MGFKFGSIEVITIMRIMDYNCNISNYYCIALSDI